MYSQYVYEQSSSPECPVKSQKISQLKSQLIQLEADDKLYNDPFKISTTSERFSISE